MKSMAVLVAGLAMAMALTPARGEPRAPESKLIVFANRSTPVNKMTTAQLRDVLLGDVTNWSNGRPVTVLFADNRSLVHALKRILNMSRDDYDNYFAVKKYQGQEPLRPRLLTSTDVVLRYLTSTPGAITVLEGEPNMTVAGAKAIRIDGKLPEDEGYRY